MKQFLAKLKILRSLDAGEPLPARWRRAVSRSQTLQQFEGAARKLDAQLKARPDEVESDERTRLHESIMRAVRREEVGQRASPSLPRFKWAFAGVIAAAVLFGGWAIHRHQSMDAHPTATLAATTVALDGNPLSQLPDVWGLVAQGTTNTQAILPQSVQELVKDVRRTTDFLLVSLP